MTDPNEAYLASQLMQRNLPVTYHTLSRAQNIHVNEAKLHLYDFYVKNKSKVQAKFVIIGKSIGTGELIKLSNDVESDTAKFASISTVHIYSLIPQTLTDADLASEELKFPSNLSNLDDYQRCGMIQGPPIVKRDEISLAPMKTLKSAAKVAVKSDVKPKEEKTKSAGLTSKYTSRKGERANTAQPTSTKRQATEPAAPKYEYKSRKSANKERVVVSHTEDEPVEVVDTPSAPKGDTDLATMFDDDWSDFGDDDNKEDKAQENEDENDQIIEVDENDKVIETIEGNDNDLKLIILEKETSKTPEPTKESDEALFVDDVEEEAIKTTVDDDGYFTSVRKPDAPVKPAPRPAPKKATRPDANIGKSAPKSKNTKATGKKQATLASFFGNKP